MINQEPTETAPSALITGASAGLGAEFARQLAHKGYNLVLVARRMDRLQALAAVLEKETGVSVDCLSADLSQEDETGLVEQWIKSLPNLEILVNNAGFGLEGSYEDNHIENTLQMINVHVNAVVRLTHAALPAMRKRERGWIINVSSMSAFLPIRNVTYSATKAFLVNFSEALETDLAGSGVHTQALCPGFTYTEFHDSPGLHSIRTGLPAWLWMDAEFVVRDSLDSLARHKVIVVPGLIYKIGYIMAKSLLVKTIARSIVMMILSRRK